jgi:radical SAM protein with 4Fe4S-binding SPASM domain
MVPSDFETILRKLKGFTDYLYFHVLGEPLLHPELALFLELSASYGYRVNITTNGTKIADRADVLLIASPLRQVNFSLHCREEADSRVVDEYLDDIFNFTFSALDRGGIYISYRLWNMTSEASERYNEYVVQKLQQKFSPGFSISEAMKESPRITLRDRLFLNSAEVFHWPAEAAGRVQDKLQDEHPDKLADEQGNKPWNKPGNTPEAADGADESGFCLGLRDQAAILTDGTVVPCCLDSEGSIKLGNIFEDGFEYILNGERARNLYEGFSNRKAVEELCVKCSYHSRFS